MERPQKRQRVEEHESEVPESLQKPISPPRKKRASSSLISSPWQLTWIRDLPEELNRDAVTLKDLLGDPLISQCWEFNFLHDIHFLMDAFDPDTKHLVDVHVVHGFWKHEDSNRVNLQHAAAEFDNVHLHVAPMPEMFGTHHSKMLILFRHDDTAQVIIHTANMISRDWTNLTNAVWKSPLLPKISESANVVPSTEHPIGSGQRFKVDLLSYLRSYDRRRITCKVLADQLTGFDFGSIRASLIASVPGRHEVHDMTQTGWGWSALKRTLQCVPSRSPDESEVVVQISSIATLGAKDDWLQKTLFGPLARCQNQSLARPKFKIVYPTADEIRRSLDGYGSGASIHTKVQSSQQAKQLEYLRPIFHHWANDSPNGKILADNATTQDGGRQRAAPHIKTYIRYNSRNTIDWALLTSANLSKQAWGDAVTVNGEVRIASWEIGVMVWPELLNKDAIMVGTFKTDEPQVVQEAQEDARPVIGVRIPYSTPLQQYGNQETPWVPTMAHSEPDWMGQAWAV
ncbi:hypothetical protein AK830_g7674 [Neonectria ditissima]|uniref:Tyrosyl-DNA phosphodiesterase 1 n=1 Tax=Neonectria ditissima TaxID=78410 RepID=A0A0P7B9M1_9HYPO|nr:hypothetical protein AK830_g7674 [Neonectria ditissima]